MTHERLRMAREQKGWSVDYFSRRAGLRPRTIELIDRGQLSELPAGLYGRSSIRSYAVAVGLNPDEVLDALTPLLPSAEDPLDGLARRCGHARRVDKAPQPALSSQTAPTTDGPMISTPPVDVPAAADPVVLRHASSPHCEEVLAPMFPALPAHAAERTWWRPLAASAIDGALLAALGGALVWLTAIACATSVPVALRLAGPGIALVFALITALYFVLFGGVGNGTPGVSLMRLDAPPAGRIVLNPRDVFGRARRSIFRDGFLVAD